jgi:Fe-S cluster biogenesis protein NfuA
MPGSLRDAPDKRNELGGPPSAALVRAALDDVRPGIVADGGNVELVQIDDDGTVTVTLQGACVGCPAAEMTLEQVIAPQLQSEVHGVTAVVAV